MSTDPRRVKEAAVELEDDETRFVRSIVKGESYKVVKKDGQWVCSYIGRPKAIARRGCVRCRLGLCLVHLHEDIKTLRQ